MHVHTVPSYIILVRILQVSKKREVIFRPIKGFVALSN